MKHFRDLTLDADALEHQRRRGSHDHYAAARARPAPDRLGDAEIEFLSRRDSFYLASVGADGWPYVQHRGGPAGFVKIVDPTPRLGRAHRQPAVHHRGHIDHDERVAIIAVDYPNRQRLKLLGHARFDPHPRADLLQRLDIDGRLEGLVTVEVIAYDWNCPKYITPRFTAEDTRAVIEPLQLRVQELESSTPRPSAPPSNRRTSLLSLIHAIDLPRRPAPSPTCSPRRRRHSRPSQHDAGDGQAPGRPRRLPCPVQRRSPRDGSMPAPQAASPSARAQSVVRDLGHRRPLS